MKPIILAVFISIAIHLLIFTNYKIPKEEILTSQQSENQIKSDITYVQLKKSEPKKVKPKAKEVVKKKIEKPVKKVIKEKPILKEIVKKDIKKVVPIIKEKSKVEPILEPKKEIVKEEKKEPRKTIQEKTLEKFLAQEEPVDKETLDTIERLYGREFETFTKVQKAFIKNNINKFGAITQKVLNRMGYPRLARKLGIGGVNVVEFTLYPDGSIKDLRISESSSYSVLDDYTLELIEIAYKDYPRPKTPTRLKFNVIYRLY